MAAATSDQLLSFFFRPQGRISRFEYILGAGVVMSIDLAFLSFLLRSGEVRPGAMLLAALVGLPLTVAMLVVAAKRCHDISLPGTFVLLLLVPFLGVFWLFVLAILPGKVGPNAYGPPPQFAPE